MIALSCDNNINIPSDVSMSHYYSKENKQNESRCSWIFRISTINTSFGLRKLHFC